MHLYQRLPDQPLIPTRDLYDESEAEESEGENDNGSGSDATGDED